MIVAFAISWTIWSPLLLPTHLSVRSRWGLYYLGVIGPTAAAFLLAGASPAVSREALVGRLLRWRVSPLWYIVAFALPFLVWTSAAVGTAALSGDRVACPTLRPLRSLLQVGVFLLLLVPFEEVGWRGYAIPVLKSRHTLMKSSVIVAFMWAVWHLPLAWATVGYQQSDRPWEYMVRFAITIVPISCLTTWLFIRTSESIVVVSLFHIAVNLADHFVVLPTGVGQSLLWSTAAIYSVIVGIVWRYDRKMQMLGGASVQIEPQQLT
jgi:uncharacterized protein